MGYKKRVFRRTALWLVRWTFNLEDIAVGANCSGLWIITEIGIFGAEMMINLKGGGKWLCGEKRQTWGDPSTSFIREPPASHLEVMVCGCISYHGVEPLAFVEGNMNSQNYIGAAFEGISSQSRSIWFRSLDLARRQCISSKARPG